MFIFLIIVFAICFTGECIISEIQRRRLKLLEEKADRLYADILILQKKVIDQNKEFIDKQIFIIDKIRNVYGELDEMYSLIDDIRKYVDKTKDN